MWFHLNILCRGQAFSLPTCETIFKLDYRRRRVVLPSTGKFKENVNKRGEKQYIEGSWEVPLLLFEGDKKPENFRDFLRVALISTLLEGKFSGVMVEVLVRRKRKEFEDFLNSRGLDYCRRPVYAIRNFVEDYLDK